MNLELAPQVAQTPRAKPLKRRRIWRRLQVRRKTVVIERSLDLPIDPIASLFATALASPDGAQGRVLAFDVGAALLQVPGIERSRCLAVVPWRPDHEALAAAGIAVLPALPPDAGMFDVVLVRLGRQRQRSLARIAEAVRHAASDGVVIVAGENELGAASYAKPLAGATRFSRHHGRAFAFGRGDAPPAALLAAWETAAAMRAHPTHGHVTAPGLFAWDRIDAGSALLARSLPADLSGVIADLGAAWGYLSRELLDGRDAVERIDLYEADWLALEAARANLQGRRADFHWHDATRRLPVSGYDAVVTNPPFHASRRAEPAIGQAFIRTAATALRPGGRLWLVANRHLPYEATLEACFERLEVVAQAEGYKVLCARAPRAQKVPG